MANKKVNEFAAFSTPASISDIVYTKQGTTEKKITVGQLRGEVASVDNYYTAGGTDNIITLTSAGKTVAPSEYSEGYTLEFIIVITSTAAVTVNPAGLGARSVNLKGSALTGGELVAGSIAKLKYSTVGSVFNLELSNTLLPNLGAPVIASDEELNILDGVIISTVELNHLSGVNSPLQPQIDDTVKITGDYDMAGSLDVAGLFTVKGNQQVATVLNLSELRGESVISESITYIKSHTTLGDGGEGNFRGITGAAPGTYVDNNGTIIVPTSGDGSEAFLRNYSGRENVLHFGADKTGATESSSAFTNALAVNGSIFMPIGSFSIKAVAITSQDEVIGENIILTQLLAADNNIDMFTVAESATYLHLKNFSVRANGKTGVNFFNQVDKSFYISHPVFSRLNIYADIEYCFKGAFIYGLWKDGIYGLSGAPGSIHVAILCKDDSGSPAAGHTLNTNSTQNNTFYNGRSTVTDEGMINVVNGDVFTSINDTFEASSIRAFYSEGIREARFMGSWFEACGDTVTLSGKVSALSSHGTQFNLESCRISNTSGATVSVFSIDAASSARMRNVESVGGASGLVLQSGGGNILEYVGKTEDSVPSGYNNVPHKFKEWFDVTGEVNVLFSVGGGAVTIDPASDTLSYALKGDICHVQGALRVSSVSSPTGALVISGLPFTSVTLTENSDLTGFAVPYEALGVAVGVGVLGRVESSSTSVKVYEQTTTTKIDTLATNMAIGTLLYFNFSYKVA